MKLLDLLTSPWAILPEQLLEIQAIYATHLRGEKIDIGAIEARLGRPLASEQQDYQIRDGGVAVLTLEGTMAPKANCLMEICGGISTQMANTQIESAMADPRVKSLVLAIDSPGGSVFGTPELGATVRELSAIKPIVTVSDAVLASAAYWVGSASNAVYISGPTVQVGSIGVVASHNYSPARDGGRVTTEITAGKYKRIASATGPLSKEGLAYMQDQVDHLYSVFVDAVAAHRGASAGDVLEQMADGRIFIGQQAIDRGLVDGYATVDAMAEQLATNPAKFSKRRKAVFKLGALPPKPAGAQASAFLPEPVPPGNSKPSTKKDSTMDRQELEQQHPALFAQLQSEFTTAGAAAERVRINSVRATVVPGHEALVEQLAFDGKTTPGEAALAVNAAVRATHTAAAAAHFADAPPAAKPSAAPSDTPPTKAEATAAAVAKTIAIFNKANGVTAHA